MDILVLPLDAGGPAPAAPDGRLGKVAELLQWLEDRGEECRLLAYLPDGGFGPRSELLGFLLKAEQRFQCGTVLLVDPERLDDAILAHPYLPSLQEIAVVLGLEEEGTPSPRVLALIDSLRAHGEEGQQAEVWLTQGDVAGAYRRLAPFLAGLPEIPLGLAPFTLGPVPGLSPGPAAAPAAPAAADGAPLALPACRLFESSLTIAADGGILACPRHCGSGGLDLGNLFVDPPERILRRRGSWSPRLAESRVCRECRLPSRFFWHGTRGEAVAGAMFPAAGEPEAESPAAVPAAAGNLPDEDLAAAVARWRALAAEADDLAPGAPSVSVEVPVIKGRWLAACVDSVLAQTSGAWHLSLLWDAGDELSRTVLSHLQEVGHPRIAVHFGEGLGIARARRYLTERSRDPYILTLDDDDVLAEKAVERLLQAAAERPWCGLVRARRGFIDDEGRPVDQADWFPFERRRYFRGMTCDLYNHSQPALIARAAYDRTAGWEGFPEYRHAGEDCDLFTKIEEVAEVHLLAEVLYHYRINPRRTSLELGTAAANDMWLRIAEKTLKRRMLPMRIANRVQPFIYTRQTLPAGGLKDIDFVIRAADAGDAGDAADTGGDGPARQALADLGVEDAAVHVLPAGECVSRRNDVARGLSRRYVCFLDGDVTPPSEAGIALLLGLMVKEPCDLAGVKVRTCGERLAGAETYFDLDMTPRVWGRGELDRGQYDHRRQVPWLPSRFLLVKREVVRSIAGFACDLGTGFLADADFSLQARLRDFRCYFAGTVAATGPAVAGGSGADEERAFHRFRRRWSGHRHLLDPRDIAAQA